MKKTTMLAILALAFLYPFAFLVSTALKPNTEFTIDPVGWVSSPTVENLSDAWNDAGLGKAILHSLIAVSVAVAVTVGISLAGAYWFVRHTGRIANSLRYGIIGTMAVPPAVFVIPLFVLLSDRQLTDNLFVLGVVFAGWNASFGLYLMYASLRGLPDEIFEAARVDGASTFQVFWRIVVPLVGPAAATLAMLAFVWSWSELLMSIVLIQDPERRLVTPATALLANEHITNVPRQAAGVVIAMIPMVMVFIVGQRALIRGFVAGVER